MAKDLLFKAAKIVTPTAQSNAELAQKQAVGVGPMAVIYKALQNQVDVTAVQLELGSIK